jgi:pilus assembly protein CpaE
MKPGLRRLCLVSPERSRLDAWQAALQRLPEIESVLALRGDALSQAARAAQSAELLLADFAPGEDGIRLLEELAARAAGMAIILLSPCRDAAFLLAAMRAGVRELLPPDANADALRAAVERLAKSLQAPPARGKLLAFVSCKGGSGATFVAANLACALAEEGLSVALIDANLQCGDALLFLSDAPPVRTLADAARAGTRLDASWLAASMTAVGPLAVLAGVDDPAQALEVLPEHMDAVLAAARSCYDWVLVDVGRNLDARSLRVLDQADLIHPVLQVTLPFIRDAGRLLQVFRSLDYPAERIRLVVNRHEKRGDIGIAEVEQTLGMGIARLVPNHYAAVAASVNGGIPMVKLAMSSPVTEALSQWSLELAGTARERAGWRQELRRELQRWQRLLRRAPA